MTAVPAATATDADAALAPAASPASVIANSPANVIDRPALRPRSPALRLRIPVAVRSLAALDALVIFCLTTLALATRLLAMRWSARPNSDEAIPGLMALHVL